MRRAIVSVTNDLSTDNRVHRTCTVLQELGYDVLLIGRMLPGSAPLERPYRTRRMRLLFRKGALFYAEYQLRLLLLLFTMRKPQLLLANDLDTLLPNFLAARIGRVPLVYDTHEFFTEVPELVHRPRVRAVWLTVERWLFPRLRTVITVNRSIANAYEERYGARRATTDADGKRVPMPVHVVRNIPMAPQLGALPARVELGLPVDKRILIMQGAGINVDRGGEEAVLAMRELPDHLLLIIGSGDAWPVLEGLVSTHGLQDRVRLLGRMPYARMMEHTRNADLGLTLDKDSNLNYRFSLPNKLFDYLYAGIPVLASDLPEVAAIVRESGAGVVVPEVAPGTIVAAVHAVLGDAEGLARMREKATFAARALDGGREAAILREIIASLG